MVAAGEELARIAPSSVSSKTRIIPSKVHQRGNTTCASNTDYHLGKVVPLRL